MASSDTSSLIVVCPEVKAARMGDIDRYEWYSSVQERCANLRGYVCVDLRINYKIHFLCDESFGVFQGYTGAELVIQDHKVYVGYTCGAQQTIRYDTCEWK